MATDICVIAEDIGQACARGKKLRSDRFLKSRPMRTVRHALRFSIEH